MHTYWERQWHVHIKKPAEEYNNNNNNKCLLIAQN